MFFIYQLQDTVEKDAHTYAYEIVKQAGRSMNYYIRHMEDIAMLLERDLSFRQQLMEEDSEGKDGIWASYNNILERYKGMSSTKGDIVSIFAFGENGAILADDNRYNIKPYINIKSLDWYEKAVEAKGKPVVSSAHIQNYLEEDAKWVFSVSVAIMDENEDRALGVILIDMNYETISDICSQIKLGERGYVYIIHNDRELIYHPKQQLIYSDLRVEDIDGVFEQNEGSYIYKEDKKLITIHTMPDLEWKIVGVSYLSELLFAQRKLIVAVSVFTVFCLMLAFIGARIIAKSISRPIKELQEAMLEVEQGNMNVVVESSANTHEINSLSKTFQTMVKRIKQLLEEVNNNQRKLRKTELKVLQAQINPHFLYNTLDTIIWLGEKEEHERVVLMTSALAKYFRLSLSKGEDIIPIAAEIDHVKNYLIIQKIRYDNKLNYEFDIDPEILFYDTIKITLQPLVENALYHGIKDRETGGVIRIVGRKVGSNICLTVEDDGAGMSQEEIDTIITRHIPKSITTGGVAIKNVHERLQIYFGKSYGLKYESELGKGTKVHVCIPIKEEG